MKCHHCSSVRVIPNFLIDKLIWGPQIKVTALEFTGIGILLWNRITETKKQEGNSNIGVMLGFNGIIVTTLAGSSPGLSKKIYL